MNDRSNDLRALMKARTSGGMNAVAATQERARQLKQLKQLQKASNMKERSIYPEIPSGITSVKANTSLQRSEGSEKKMKTVSLATLVSSSIGQGSEPAPTSSDQLTSSNITKVGLVQEERLGAYTRTPEDAVIPMQPTPKELPSDTVDSGMSSNDVEGLPKGFFDKPQEGIAAKGLNVIQEMNKKKQEQDDIVNSFLGEVNTLLNEGENEDNHESDIDPDSDNSNTAEEMALQLAYEARTANFMANLEKKLENKHPGHRNELSEEKCAPEVNETEVLIAEVSGLKRSASDTIYSDVLNVMQQKKVKLQNLKVSSIKNTYDDGNDEGSESDSNNEDYEPLDFTDWQSRTL